MTSKDIISIGQSLTKLKLRSMKLAKRILDMEGLVMAGETENQVKYIEQFNKKLDRIEEAVKDLHE